MVYVISIEGKPLMPCKEAKSRKLLRDKKAHVVKRTPFTIQLDFECENQTQDITLGVDAGSKMIGLSASTYKKELFSAEYELRNDISEKLSTRSESRKARRSRLRYRKPRFNNRVSTKKKGWIAPSIKHKKDSHLKIISDICKILPVTDIIVEVASFDIQKIKNPDIKGKEYQEGEQSGSWNVREYVLCRDNHTCQHCEGKTRDKILNVHHIESRKTGGDSPGNLVTLCKTCHDRYHKGKIKLDIERDESFKDTAFMGIMRWSLYNSLKEIYPSVRLTYGYITKNTRITKGLPKTHRADAYCIAGNFEAAPLEYYYYFKKVRCHNRQMYLFQYSKGNIKKNNQSPYYVFGMRLYDKVSYKGRDYFIYGRRKSGCFDLRNISGDTSSKIERVYKKLKVKEPRKRVLVERRANGQFPTA